jgi:NAD(P)-dependent dehydrogenase (short-subunit alcohol dehydrogenase family)
LAQAGAKVVVVGRDEGKAQRLASELKDEGLAALARGLDATRGDEVQNSVERLADECGSIDILVNCLGQQREQSLLSVTEEAFDEVYRNTVKAALFLAQSVARRQVALRRGGRHIHLLSLRALFGFRDRGYSAFCAAKGGLALLVRQHAAELARDGITVNGVAPGAVHTHKNAAQFADPQRRAAQTAAIPLGRMAEPADVAAAVLFLSAPAADFITGQIIVVDGGVSACQ